jgi:hypothetical protein
LKTKVGAIPVQIVVSQNVNRGEKMQLAAFKLFNRSIWQKGEVISVNHHTVWVRIPKVLSPKGRLLRRSRPIKRHIRKDAVLLGNVFTPSNVIEDIHGGIIGKINSE